VSVSVYGVHHWIISGHAYHWSTWFATLVCARRCFAEPGPECDEDACNGYLAKEPVFSERIKGTIIQIVWVNGRSNYM
jgi:hypothetical protein